MRRLCTLHLSPAPPLFHQWRREGGAGNVCGCKLVTNYVQHKLRRWLWLWPGQGFPSFYSFHCVRRFKQPHPATPTVTCPFWAMAAAAAAATNQRKRKWQWKWKCSTTEQMMRNRRQLSKRCENLSQKMMKNRKMLTLLAHIHRHILTHTHTDIRHTHYFWCGLLHMERRAASAKVEICDSIF